jgi:hypothetical protein
MKSFEGRIVVCPAHCKNLHLKPPCSFEAEVMNKYSSLHSRKSGIIDVKYVTIDFFGLSCY